MQKLYLALYWNDYEYVLIWLQTIEEEANRRIELLVKKRVEEELEKRKDEIESEVQKRVEAAKAEMEREMMLELEKRREAARLEEQKREVNIFNVGADQFETFSLFDFVSISLILLSFGFSSRQFFFSIYWIYRRNWKLIWPHTKQNKTKQNKNSLQRNKDPFFSIFFIFLFNTNTFCGFCFLFFSFTTRIMIFSNFPFNFFDFIKVFYENLE